MAAGSAAGSASILFGDAARRAQAVKLARYLSSQKGEADDNASLLASVRALAAGDAPDSAAIAQKFAGEVGLAASLPEKELESVVNLLHAFIADLKSPDAVRALAAAVAANPARPAARLRLLTNFYNALAETDPARCDVFEAIVGVAAGAGEMGVLEEFLPRLDSEMVRWGLDADRTRAVYALLSEKYAEQGDRGSLQAYQFLLKNLTTYESSSSTDSAAALAGKAVVEALRIPAVFNLEEPHRLRAVQALRGKSAAFELLELFLEGDLAAYRAWTAKNPGKLAELGLDEADAERKIRMLSLAGLAGGKEGKEVEYRTIVKALEIQESEVEIWVIDAIRAGLLDARMNQVTKTVAVRRATVRSFTMDHWKQLASKLEGWKEGLAEILQVLGNARVLVENQMAAGENAAVEGAPRR
ncbi:hypothetical protein DFJ74DRAFT_706499 [Hyaloraphidium curvatum]|nr:hypothetical protein DFJ74DRAFT_706499 [Hyaloraphidium curvatum]